MRFVAMFSMSSAFDSPEHLHAIFSLIYGMRLRSASGYSVYVDLEWCLMYHRDVAGVD